MIVSNHNIDGDVHVGRSFVADAVVAAGAVAVVTAIVVDNR
jgi:hypothetical protein